MKQAAKLSSGLQTTSCSFVCMLLLEAIFFIECSPIQHTVEATCAHLVDWLPSNPCAGHCSQHTATVSVQVLILAEQCMSAALPGGHRAASVRSGQVGVSSPGYSSKSSLQHDPRKSSTPSAQPVVFQRNLSERSGSIAHLAHLERVASFTSRIRDTVDASSWQDNPVLTAQKQ